MLDAGKRTEILETIGMLTGNLEKVVDHGRRADGIVRSMLQHSRGGSDDWQPTDLNTLVEEALLQSSGSSLSSVSISARTAHGASAW